jgi:hypothetical protein
MKQKEREDLLLRLHEKKDIIVSIGSRLPKQGRPHLDPKKKKPRQPKKMGHAPTVFLLELIPKVNSLITDKESQDKADTSFLFLFFSESILEHVHAWSE